MNKFEIRKAVPDDVQVILQLINELAVFEKLEHEVVATQELLQRNLFGESHVAHALIGELDGKPVGMALYFYNFSTFLARPGIYLEDLIIRSEFRSRGFGEAMIRHLVKIASEEKCGRVEWAVLNWNARAIKFYQSLGAELKEEWTTCRIDEEGMRNLLGN
ncbi:MAG: GNAT family N-acetyltransferase [Deferribacteres bacterium]|nr:GNAT family N-acetyltransferase [candidate division KSB1 bacterium]MCB9501905.1 GNAT family N-acetyltransferase [Deferribacteres bacterium]